MPVLVRKLVVIAAAESLTIQPAPYRNQRTSSLAINYKTHEISSLASSEREADPSNPSFEAHAIVGLLTVVPVSYLIIILRRQQVAQIKGIPIYVVTDVAIIPLSSQDEASKAVDQAKGNLKKGSGERTPAGGDTSDEEGSDHGPSTHTGDVDHSPVSTDSPTADLPLRPAGPRRSISNVAEDVIGRKGQYGRFAEKWFSREGWSTERRRVQGMSTDEGEKPSSTVPPVGTTFDGSTRPKQTESFCQPKLSREVNQPKDSPADTTNTLLPKLLRTTRMLLSSQSFFFSYDLDITRRLGTHGPQGSGLSLHKTVDPLFFWNRHLTMPFIDGGHHAFVLPLMQGFVGQRAFSVDRGFENPAEAISHAGEGPQKVANVQNKDGSNESSSDFLITLISRRSIKRPGLRYLRRGVDDAGNTANTVETEQILSLASWAASSKVYSLTQIRGSIPLYFSQSPYAFKPVPVLQHLEQENYAAFQRHFDSIMKKYGEVQIVLLVDKSGGEAEIGKRYQDTTKKFNESETNARKLAFEWFDFHKICRGMKFENVSLLMDSVGGQLDKYGETVEIDSTLQKRQLGVLRTNCMDCLDRTNVVQSACGQRALEGQLLGEGVKVDLRTDVSTQWFNTLWADNGDAISKQYASTAALKGDYTRTRRRNYRGAINDLGLTLSRYYNNIVNDYFSQAATDYLLGNVTPKVFEDFEDKMMSEDPAMSMEKVRANAVETSQKVVIEDQSENLIGGWTILSPHDSNTVRTFPLEEVILLLTDAALYSVRFDWNNEKTASFERVDLRNITGVIRGVYITSTLTISQTDEQRNVGLVVKYQPGKEDVARVNTRSLSSAVGLDGGKECDPEEKEKTRPSLRILALKALPAKSSSASDDQEMHTMSEKELVETVCDEIQRAALGSDNGVTNFFEDRDIISLQEARKSTGLLEQWSHSLKKMVWQ